MEAAGSASVSNYTQRYIFSCLWNVRYYAKVVVMPVRVQINSVPVCVCIQKASRVFIAVRCTSVKLGDHPALQLTKNGRSRDQRLGLRPK